jgi:hypothetical protein
VLTGVLGWPGVERVWLPEWLADPEAVVTRVVTALMATERPVESVSPVPEPAVSVTVPAPPGLSAVVRPTPAPAPAVPPIPSVGLPATPVVEAAEAETFVPWTVRHLGYVDVLNSLPSRWAASAVAAALAEVVAADGPIHSDRLARLVANGYGLTRVAEARKAAILRQLPRDLRQERGEPVIWPPDRDPETWTAVRRSGEGVDRPFEHVPLREIVNAMVVTVRETAGMPRDELLREVLAIFGWRRRTSAFVERVDVALGLGMRSRRLIVDNDFVTSC